MNATNGGGSLLSRHSGTTSTFYTFDAQGNVSERLSSTGTVQTASTFDAFGLSTSTGTVSDPFGYCGEWGYYTDQESGLQLATYRYYDPSAGRFLTRDPISYAGGINLYNYTHNNEINLQDARGTDACDCADARDSAITFVYFIVGAAIAAIGISVTIALEVCHLPGVDLAKCLAVVALATWYALGAVFTYLALALSNIEEQYQECMSEL